MFLWLIWYAYLSTYYNVKLFAVIIETLQVNFGAFSNTILSWKFMYEHQRKPLSKLKLQF